jgi:hypothetical protein
MLADWECEIAPDAPVIDAAWAGFLDLRRHPEQVAAIAELAQLPALGPALLRLNAADSPVFTAKCDVWKAGEVDPDELDSTRERATHAVASYIDLLPATERTWSSPETAAAWSRSVCALLGNIPVRQCRVDLVIRAAFFTPVEMGIGISCYCTGCGANESEAAEMLSQAVRALSDAAARVSGTAGLPTRDAKESG